MILIWGVTLLCAVMAGSTHEIHKRMTPDERLQVFQTHDENVQKYEVVPIHWPQVQKRSTEVGTGIRMKAFGEDIELWLKPADGMLAGYDTPVYLLGQEASGPSFKKYSNVMQELEQYEDLKKSAVVVTRRSRNTRRIVGTVGSHNLVITPIPARLIEEVRRHRRSVDDFPESAHDDHHYHIVYKRSSSAGKAEYMEESLADIPATFTAESSSIPDTVYPEILVVVTNDLFIKLGGDVWDALAYMLAFWSGVDLRYRSLESPKYRLNIAGIVLAQDAEALSYIAEHEFDGKSLVADRALRSSSGYWLAQNHYIPVESYDVLVTMTSRGMCQYGRGSNCQFGVHGLAYTGGACNMIKIYQVLSKVSIVEDSGGFDGIHVAAHELGHLLGAKHDGEIDIDCPLAGGHIMSPAIPLDRSPDWSNCTLKDFQTFLNKGPVCLYNNPIQKKVLPRYLPGKFMDADQQCKKYAGTQACRIDYSICGRLGCVIEGDSRSCRQILGGAADGTTCGPGQMCLHGLCLDESRF